MNIIMEAITRMCNLQRDKHLRPEENTKKKRKGKGFDEILRKEESKLNGIQNR